MLSQPIGRKSLFSGLFFGLVIPLQLGFIFGIGTPIFFNLNVFTNSWIELFTVLLSGSFLILIFTALAFLIASFTDDKLKGLGLSLFLLLFYSIIYDGLILFILQMFQDYPMEKLALGLTLINPIDIARMITVLKFDVSALMGYTGAVFENFFGDNLGVMISILIMIIWFIGPFLIGLKKFSNKDV
jgi:Cu-processing system permease protein